MTDERPADKVYQRTVNELAMVFISTAPGVALLAAGEFGFGAGALIVGVFAACTFNGLSRGESHD